VKPFHYIGRRYTDGAYEELCLLLDDDGDEVVQQALGVVVIGLSRSRTKRRDEEIDAEG